MRKDIIGTNQEFAEVHAGQSFVGDVYNHAAPLGHALIETIVRYRPEDEVPNYDYNDVDIIIEHSADGINDWQNINNKKMTGSNNDIASEVDVPDNYLRVSINNNDTEHRIKVWVSLLT